MTAKNVRKIEIFVSSPSDVATERAIVKSVVERLRKKPRLSKRLTFEALAYEDWVPASVGTEPQRVVNKYMKMPHECEIFICVLWHRMGTPLRIDDQQFESGTHFEFVDAYKANQAKQSPLILLYRGQKPYPLTVDGDQLAKVDRFFEQFHGAEAEYKGLYKLYYSDAEFEQILIDDLERVIEDFIDIAKPDSSTALWERISQRISLYTQRMLGVRYKEKYSPAYYSPRPEIIEHFDSFLRGDKTLMSFTGKAGTGKSCFVSDLASNKRDGLTVWLQDCAILKLDDSMAIDDLLHDELGIPDGMSLFSAFEQIAIQHPEQTLLFLFDAVNEFETPSTLLKKISEFVIRVNTDNVKVVVTCRLPAWDMLKRLLGVPVTREFHPAGPNSFVSFADSFSDDEIEKIYQLYQESYSLKTQFRELPSTVKEFITQPLFLKLTAVAYQDKSIPQQLSLRDVLRKYIDYCLQIDSHIDGEPVDYESLPEFQVLRAAIQLMYEKAKREIDVATLKENAAIGKYVSVDLSTRTPYTQLVNEGLLSQQISEEFARRIEIVFVTYERVFEYLLAWFKIPFANIRTIEDALETSKRLSFLQLRGAAELSLTFAITDKLLDKSEFIELAKRDSPEIHQFLSEVLQTIYSSGHRQLALDMISELINVKPDHHSPNQDEEVLKANAANQLAVRAAYQIHLDEELVKFAMSKNPLVRDLASLYLYQRWNKARLDGRLVDAYQPIEAIAKKIRLPIPIPGTIQALSALVAVSLNLMAHIIDDIDSLVPLLTIWRNIIRQIPGIEPRPSRNPIDIFAKRITDMLIDVVTQVMLGLVKQSIIGDVDLLNRFWAEPRTERAFMDASVLFNEHSLLQHEERIRKLLAWEHDLVPYALMCPLMHHLYQDPVDHLQMLQTIFYDVDTFVFRTRYQLTVAMTFAGLSRVLRGKPIDDDYSYQVEANLYELWRMISESETDSVAELFGNLTRDEAIDRLGLIFVGLMHIEVLKQVAEGKIQGSKMFVRFIEALDDITEVQLKVLIRSVENVSYLGFPDFAVLTLLQDDVRRLWQRRTPQIGLKSLANMRSFYQDEVDSLFAQRKDIDSTVLNEVRLIGSIPHASDVLFATSNLLMVACAVEPAVTKMAGNIMGDLVFFSGSLKDFVRSTSRTLIIALFDFEAINVTHFQWGTLHNPNWDNFEMWNIPRDIDTKKQDIHEYWHEIISKFIVENGRGIVYDEL